MTRPPLMSFDDARAQLLSAARPVSGLERLATLAACGRVLAQDVHASINVPPLDNTQMDGYALRVADLKAQPGSRLRVTQRIPAGRLGVPLEAGCAARIFTGAPIPVGADAVVMQEATRAEGDSVLVDHVPEPGEWIRRAGEDIAAGSVILSAGTVLSPQACGLAASVGLAELPVKPRLRAACFFTGDELVMPGEPLPAGRIYNSNRFVLHALLSELGCEVLDLGIVPDSLAATRAALREAAANSDLIVTSGGVSVGEEDHVRPAVQAEGELALWQIAMKPGKPLAFGHVQPTHSSGRAFFVGLPGNPVSSLVTFVLLVRPFVRALQGGTQGPVRAIDMRADFDWPKPDRRREFLRVARNDSGGLSLFPNQGSGVLTSTVWADGLVDNPGGQCIAKGDRVRYLPLSELLA